jgi:hypothetical protein
MNGSRAKTPPIKPRSCADAFYGDERGAHRAVQRANLMDYDETCELFAESTPSSRVYRQVLHTLTTIYQNRLIPVLWDGEAVLFWSERPIRGAIAGALPRSAISRKTGWFRMPESNPNF